MRNLILFPSLFCLPFLFVTRSPAYTSSIDFLGKENYITNLYFLYLLELRALAKIAPYLIKKVNWKSSGDSALTRDAIRDLLQSVRSVLLLLYTFKTLLPNLREKIFSR